MALGAAALAATSLTAGSAVAGTFWAGDEPHMIVAVSEPQTYEVCNLSHVSHENMRADLSVDADGRVFLITPGRCSHVEGAEIAVMSASAPAVAMGSFEKVD